MEIERARLFTAMPRGAFPKPGQLRGTGITGRENESRLGSLRLIQALTWLPEPALPQPSRAGEDRMASLGKVRLLKCKKLRKEGTVERLDYFHCGEAGERFVRAEEWVRGITRLEKRRNGVVRASSAQRWAVLVTHVGAARKVKIPSLGGVLKPLFPLLSYPTSPAVCPHPECVSLPSKREENQPRFKPQ